MPSVLFFTIQRLNYDVKSMRLVKNYKRFEFEKMIYADKYMLQNRLKDEEMNAQIQGLREKQKEIRQKLKEYNEYYKGLSLREVIKVTKDFIELQSEDFIELDKDGENKDLTEEVKSPL